MPKHSPFAFILGITNFSETTRKSKSRVNWCTNRYLSTSVGVREIQLICNVFNVKLEPEILTYRVIGSNIQTIVGR